MSGWGTLKAIRSLENRVEALGFELAVCSFDCGSDARVSLKARGDCLPHYSREAEIWMGSLEELQFWVNGVEWARNYDKMLKISDAKKREAAEQKEINRHLMNTLKEGKRVTGTVE